MVSPLTHKVVTSSGRVDFSELQRIFNDAVKILHPDAIAVFVGSTRYLGDSTDSTYVSDIDYIICGIELSSPAELKAWTKRYHNTINSLLGDEGYITPSAGSSEFNATYIATLALSGAYTQRFPLHAPLFRASKDIFLKCSFVDTILIWRYVTDKNNPGRLDADFCKQHPTKAVKRCIAVLQRVAHTPRQRAVYNTVRTMYLHDMPLADILTYVEDSYVLQSIAPYMLELERSLGISKNVRAVFQSERVGDAARDFVARAGKQIDERIIANYPELIDACKVPDDLC